MMFEPFSTLHLRLGDVPAALSERSMNPLHKTIMTMPESYMGIDEIHIYTGRPTGNELLNFKGFIQHNNLIHPTGATLVWNYDVIIAVGINALSQIEVDIPISMFPWTIPLYHHLDTPGIFDLPVTHDFPITHKLASRCAQCVQSKVACVPAEGMQCQRCEPGGCMATDLEEKARIKACFNAAAANAFALSPPFQHLIQSVKARLKYNGAPKMPYQDRAALTRLVQEEYVGVDEGSDSLIINNADAYQVVRFYKGELHFNLSSNVEDNREGFHYHEDKGKKCKLAACVPHLGLPSWELAYSLIDNALQRPGKVHWLNSCVWRRGAFVNARIYMNATILAENDITMTIGWVFKK